MAVDALDIGGMRPIVLPDGSKGEDPRISALPKIPESSRGIPLSDRENAALAAFTIPEKPTVESPALDSNAEQVAQPDSTVIHYSEQGPAKLTERGVNTDPNAARDTINRFKSNIFGPEGYQTIEPDQLPFEMVGQAEAAKVEAAAAAKIDAENNANKPEKSFTQTINPVVEPAPIVGATPTTEPTTETPVETSPVTEPNAEPKTKLARRRALMDQPEGPVLVTVSHEDLQPLPAPVNQ